MDRHWNGPTMIGGLTGDGSPKTNMTEGKDNIPSSRQHCNKEQSIRFDFKMFSTEKQEHFKHYSIGAFRYWEQAQIDFLFNPGTSLQTQAIILKHNNQCSIFTVVLLQR